jgi:alanine-glyoxylate transaminase/serine-glyoxylate transaminase/serine-pyruvate transaminase
LGSNSTKLMIPGPIDLEPDVLAALGQQVIAHYGPEWVKIYTEARDGIRRYAETDGDVFLLSASGSAGLDAAVGSLFAPGERVLVVVNGYFSNRLLLIARGNGLDAEPLEMNPGNVATAEGVRSCLKTGSYDGLLICHSETATGALNPVDEICAVANEFGVTILMDSVSSFAACETRMDEWNVSICCTASQKALGGPPGVAPVIVSPIAWERINRVGDVGRGWYTDLRTWKSFVEEMPDYHPQPATMSVNIIRALATSVSRQQKEDLAVRYARMAASAAELRSRVRSLGFTTVAPESHASPTVTAFFPPTGRESEAPAIIQYLQDEVGLVVAKGMGELDSRVVRTGHMSDAAYGPYADLLVETLESYLQSH